MLSYESIEQYAMSVGLLISFFGLILVAWLGRSDIIGVFRSLKLRKRDLALPIAVAVLFVAVELTVVVPTQLLFFDDVINQGMAQQFLNSLQAWQCNYGTPKLCYQGDVFHEPIGAAFNIAIGFFLFGISRNVAYGVGVAASTIAIMFSFFVAYMLFKDIRMALFSELLMALSPILLTWAMPTQSDVYLMAYSLVAFFFMEVFRYRKNVATFTMLVLSVSLATYMKVDAFLLVPIIAVMYVLMDDKNVLVSLRRNVALFRANLLNTRFLLVLMLAIIVISPEFIYATQQAATGDYGAVGAIQNTCNNFSSGTVNATFDLMNFEYNFCGNALFWLNNFSSQGIIQPPLFTALAIVGVVSMAFYSRNTAGALGVWFLAFFLLYCAFYAGSVNYGVDWRFQLSLIPPASMFGGYGCATIVNAVSRKFRNVWKPRAPGSRSQYSRLSALAVTGVLLLCIAYSIALFIPQLSIKPAFIQQAADARFYENMVYNSTYLIPPGSIVFSYDPELFNINNITSRQLSDIYNPSVYDNMSLQYSHIVVDWGYWCYTPNNLCTALNQSFTMVPIYTDLYKPENRTYGFYLVTGTKNQ